MNRIRKPGFAEISRRASAGPFMSGMTMSVSNNSIASV